MTLSEVAGRYFFLYIFRKELSASVTSSDNGGNYIKTMHPALLQLLSFGLLADLMGNPQEYQTTINDSETGETLLLTDDESDEIRAIVARARPRHHRMILLLEYAEGIELSELNVDSLDVVSRSINAALGLRRIPQHMIRAAQDIMVEIEDMRHPVVTPRSKAKPPARLKAKRKPKPRSKKK